MSTTTTTTTAAATATTQKMEITRMEKGALAAYRAAKKLGACKSGLKWLREYGKDDWHAQPRAMGMGWVSWALREIPEHVPAPTPEQVDRGMADEGMSADQIDWGKDENGEPKEPEEYEDYWVRIMWAKRLDFTPTPEQVDKGLTDEYCHVRVSWIFRPDFTPTPEQVERGLADEDPDVRRAWEIRTRDTTK